MTLANPSDVTCEVTGHEISGRAEERPRHVIPLNAIVRTFPYIQFVFTFLFQRLKYCITSRSRWQPICGKAKRGAFRYPFCADADRGIFFVYENIFLFQVARCHDLRIADGLLALRRRDRSGDLPEYISRRGGLPRGAVRGCFGAGEGLRRKAFGARPKV